MRVTVILACLLMTAVPLAGADPIVPLPCAANHLVDEACASLEVEGAGKGWSTIMRNGDTSALADVQWTAASVGIPASLDFGTYNQGWHVIYEGDEFCKFDIGAAAWRGSGYVHLIYFSWDFDGQTSDGQGERGQSIDAGYTSKMVGVAAADGSPNRCDQTLVTEREEAADALATGAQQAYDEWAADIGGSASFQYGAVSECGVGTIASGSQTVAGTAFMNSAGGARLSTQFHIEGLSDDLTVYEGKGTTNAGCIIIDELNR